MGILDSNRPNVSPREFEHVNTFLRSEGFSESDVDNIKKIFHGDLDESKGNEGVDRKEVMGGVGWLRRNMSKHSLSRTQIDKLEQHLKKNL